MLPPTTLLSRRQKAEGFGAPPRRRTGGRTGGIPGQKKRRGSFPSLMMMIMMMMMLLRWRWQLRWPAFDGNCGSSKNNSDRCRRGPNSKQQLAAVHNKKSTTSSSRTRRSDGDTYRNARSIFLRVGLVSDHACMHAQSTYIHYPHTGTHIHLLCTQNKCHPFGQAVQGVPRWQKNDNLRRTTTMERVRDAHLVPV